jgi:hypothetical protein
MTAHWTVKNASGELLTNFSSVSPLEVARKVVPDALSVLWSCRHLPHESSEARPLPRPRAAACLLPQITIR